MNPEQSTSESEPEKIECAALVFRGEIFTSASHAEAIDTLSEKYPDWAQSSEGIEEGWMTTKKRVISRREALEIAKTTDQIKYSNLGIKGLTVEDLK